MTTDFAKRTSIRVAQQLPEFLRTSDDYETFRTFIQAYYEWMEQYNIGDGKEGATRATQSLLDYNDIDFINPGETYNKFIEYYINEFVPNFPKDALTDKTKFVKIAKQLYENKGTPASYQFLFRALYNSDAEIFLTREAVFKASDGKWYVSKSLRLATNDEQWLSTNNLRIFGETSKSIATIERAIAIGSRTELYISNIERLFQSGENVIVVDNNNRTLYFKDSKIVPEGTSGSTSLEAKILGTISSVNINAQKRGQLYQVGDPVVFYGGLNSTTGIGAQAYIDEVTSGSIRAIDVIDGSYGYRPDPNTFIRITGGGGSGAIANVTTVDPAGEITVNFIPRDYLSNAIRSTRLGGTSVLQIQVLDYTANATIITANAVSTTGLTTGDTILIVGANTNLKLSNTYTVTVANSQYFFINNINSTPTGTWVGIANTGFTVKGAMSSYAFLPANTSSDITSSLANSLSFTSFSTFPIDSVIVNNGGGGYTSLPDVGAESLYPTLDPTNAVKGKLGSLGILGPIEINIPGTGYSNNDFIIFSNGRGVGANANVSVNATGSIVNVFYQYANTGSQTIRYPKGGLGYDLQNMPTLTIQTVGGSGANLSVNYILGEGATFEVTPDERGIGAITSFAITNFGEDYISAPNVSLRVRDLVIKNVSTSNLVNTDELIYQGTSVNTSVFRANVSSISLLEADANPANSKYLLRVYNYTSNTKTNLQLKVTDRIVGANLYYDLDTTYSSNNFINGIKTYGNGAARATAKFLNGLIIGEGQYLNDDGFPSSFQILENEVYNNYSYQLTVQKSFEAYKDLLYKLVHPSGTNVIPFNALKSNEDIVVHRESFVSNNHTLGYYTGDPGSLVNIYTTFENPSNNIIKFTSLVGANIEQFLFEGASISIKTAQGPNVFSQISSIMNSSANVALMKDNVFLAFANVATANVTVSNNRINILSVTDQYDLINNGDYSNTQNKLEDIVFIGDRIRVVNGASVFHGTVTYVSYANGVIFANTTVSFSSNNANVSIRRDISSSDVLIYNNLGSVFYPQLVTQSGEEIVTQDERTLILG